MPKYKNLTDERQEGLLLERILQYEQTMFNHEINLQLYKQSKDTSEEAVALIEKEERAIAQLEVIIANTEKIIEPIRVKIKTKLAKEVPKRETK